MKHKCNPYTAPRYNGNDGKRNVDCQQLSTRKNPKKIVKRKNSLKLVFRFVRLRFESEYFSGTIVKSCSRRLILCRHKAKGQSQNGCDKKKHVKFSEKRTFLTHTHVCVSGGKKCSFFGKFGVLCFLVTPVLRFALLPYYRRLTIQQQGYLTR